MGKLYVEQIILVDWVIKDVWKIVLVILLFWLSIKCLQSSRSARYVWLQSTEAVSHTPPSRGSRAGKLNRLANSEETPDKTDGESSYSSFYSSFFKTESGSAEESLDPKKLPRVIYIHFIN